MHCIKLDKNGSLCLPRQVREFLDIKGGDLLKFLVVDNELHIHKCNLGLCKDNALITGDFDPALAQRS